MLYKMMRDGSAATFFGVKPTTLAEQGYAEKAMEKWLAQNPHVVLPDGARMLAFGQAKPFQNFTDILRSGREKLFALVALIAEPTAYSDESWTPHKAFVVAGYLAPLEEWKRFEQRWNEGLRDESISEFKMRDCQQMEGEFAGWNEDRSTRAQERFISIITSSGLTGVLCGIDVDAYDQLAPNIRPLVHPKVWKPCNLAFQHQIEYVAGAVRHFPAYERVSFVFDRQTEHQSNALAQYNSMAASRDWYAPRLGAISFGDSNRYPGLQAADAVAFEFRRWLMEQVYRNHPTQGRRWQWDALNKGRLIGGYFNKGALLNYVDALKVASMVISGNFDAEGHRRSRKGRSRRTGDGAPDGRET